MKVKSESEVAQSCSSPSDPMDCSLPVSLLLLLLLSCSVMSDSLRAHGPQPTRLFRPWDFSGESTGVGARAFSQAPPYSSLIALSCESFSVTVASVMCNSFCASGPNQVLMNSLKEGPGLFLITVFLMSIIE